MKNNCPLCEPEIVTWREEGFYGTVCKTCGTPLIVFQVHSPKLCKMEEHDFHMLAQKHYPDERPRGEGMLDNEGHWHEHMI